MRHEDKMRSAYTVLVGRSEGMRPRHTWEDNIKVAL
jgi:hypothetical protein